LSLYLYPQHQNYFCRFSLYSQYFWWRMGWHIHAGSCQELHFEHLQKKTSVKLVLDWRERSRMVNMCYSTEKATGSPEKCCWCGKKEIITQSSVYSLGILHLGTIYQERPGKGRRWVVVFF
jgi:hypothetical protein